jgi:hypothetical protein
MGVQDVSDDAMMEILKEVKAAGTKKRGLLSPDEFKEIIDRKLP